MLHGDTRLYTFRRWMAFLALTGRTGGTMSMLEHIAQEETLLTFKEAMGFLRVSRSTLYRLMWSGQLRGHKVGSTWRFYKQDLRSVVASTPTGVGSRLLSESFAPLHSTQITSEEDHRWGVSLRPFFAILSP